MKKLYFLITLFVLSCIQLIAQNTSNEPFEFKGEVIRCYTVEATAALEKKEPLFRKSNANFEEWLKPLVESAKYAKKEEEVIVIPVVVHVIHNGDEINTPGNIVGENISYAQAASQINVLNQDFRRLAGTPGAEVTNYGLGVDTRIEFKLATIAPDGTATNGVNRVYFPKEYWTSGEVDSQLKPATIWDPTKYLNMWSVKFGGSSGNLLGYAQFPSQSGLDGMPGNGGSASTDGVVANYATFGTRDLDDGSFSLGAPYDRGRTMTHEVGHWLGLRHIWGDGDCSVDDYVEDTPNQDGSSAGCPIGQQSCGSVDMIENYMDYSYDACMNTFTEGQRLRMVTVMKNSPRRKELLNSNAFDTSEYVLDAKIAMQKAKDKSSSPCNPQEGISPIIELSSTGPTPITSVTISYGIEGGTQKTHEWSGNLNQFESVKIELPIITEGLVDGDNKVKAEITSVNGGTDEFEKNNISTGDFDFSQEEIKQVTEVDFVLKIKTDRYGTETTWKVKDENGTVVKSGGPYKDKIELHEESFTLDPNKCYSFSIYDDYGDGFSSGAFYELATASGIKVAFGGAITFTEITTGFTIGSLSTNDVTNAANQFQVSPNPSNGIVKITHDFVNAKFLVNVYDLSGKLVTKRTQSNKTVDLSNLKPGVYVIEIKDGKETFSDKLIIK